MFQFAGQASAMQEDLGDDRDILTADMDDDLEDETGHIQEVVQQPMSRKERRKKKKAKNKK